MNVVTDDHPIFSYKNKSFYDICTKRPLTFGCASLQKYFFNIQWHKEKTFKRLYFQNYFNIIKKVPLV